MRCKSVITLQKHYKGLLEVSLQAQENYSVSTVYLHCDYVRYFSTPTEVSRRCSRTYGAVTATSLRFYCVFIRTKIHGAALCMLKGCAVGRRSTMFQAIPPRQINMPLLVKALQKILLRVPWRFKFTLSQDAAGSF